MRDVAAAAQHGPYRLSQGPPLAPLFDGAIEESAGAGGEDDLRRALEVALAVELLRQRTYAPQQAVDRLQGVLELVRVDDAFEAFDARERDVRRGLHRRGHLEGLRLVP